MIPIDVGWWFEQYSEHIERRQAHRVWCSWCSDSEVMVVTVAPLVVRQGTGCHALVIMCYHFNKN